MTPTERATARAEHREANARTATARTALATEKATLDRLEAARAALVEKAARGSDLSAGDLVRASAAVNEARAAVELAEAVFSAARDRASTLGKLAAQADELDRSDRLAAAIARRIEAAARVDAALADARAAMAELDQAGLEARDAGLANFQQYHIRLSREPMPSNHWAQHNITSLAETESAVHGLAKAKAA